MSTLQFKGKNIIWNHHISVLHHTLGRAEELNLCYNYRNHHMRGDEK